MIYVNKLRLQIYFTLRFQMRTNIPHFISVNKKTVVYFKTPKYDLTLSLEHRQKLKLYYQILIAYMVDSKMND